MGLGLAHNAFDRSNAMLALSGISKFSAKNIRLVRRDVFSFRAGVFAFFDLKKGYFFAFREKGCVENLLAFLYKINKKEK